MLTLRTVTSVLVTTGKPSTLIPVSVSTAGLPAMEFIGQSLCAAPHSALLSLRRSQSRAGERPRASSTPCTEQGQAWLKAGLWTQAGAGPGCRGGTCREPGLPQSCTASAGAPACHHSGISNVQPLCVCWESHWLEVNLLMQQNTLFLKVSRWSCVGIST